MERQEVLRPSSISTPPATASPPAADKLSDEIGELFQLLQNPQALLTPRQVSIWLGWSERTLSGQRYRGIGPRFIRLGSKQGVRYRVATVERWLKRRERGSTADERGQ